MLKMFARYASLVIIYIIITSRVTDNRCIKCKFITEWRPMDGKRTIGRAVKRWRDEIDTFSGTAAWNRHAQNREERKRHVEAFSNMWIDKRLIMMVMMT